jgi:biopolymer transport protein ExbD
MRKPLSIVLGCFLLISACDGEEKEEAAEGPKGPVLGVLELPVALRTGDAAPDGRKVDVGLTELRVDDKTVLTLDGGKITPADRAGDVAPKLKEALQTPAKNAIVLSAHSGLPYETIALIMSSAYAAGIRDLALAVRKPGGGSETGFAVYKNFSITPRTDDEVTIASVQPHTWDEMTAAWQAIHDACRTSETGSCAYVPTEPAKGGNLKIVLHAAGQGVNLGFFRVGLTPEQLAEEEKARLSASAAAKEDVVQGRKKQTDVAEELEAGPPASEALFQFRAQEALEMPSALSETIRPLCGNRQCGAVVSAESATLLVRVASLIGAAFPDGGAAPALAFELPWTEKPKRVAPPPAAEPAK